jgi:hypothetical protein
MLGMHVAAAVQHLLTAGLLAAAEAPAAAAAAAGCRLLAEATIAAAAADGCRWQKRQQGRLQSLFVQAAASGAASDFARFAGAEQGVQAPAELVEYTDRSAKRFEREG